MTTDDPHDKQIGREAINTTGGDHIDTGGGDYAGRDIDKRQGGAFIEDSVVHGDVIGYQTNYYRAPATSLDRQQQRNRRAMLQKVKTIWITGLLEHSLAEVVKIDLGLVD